MILHLRNIYSTFGIIIAAFPLIGISIIFKLYFSSDSQNRYLYKVNGLAIKLNEQQNVKKIIELYLSSWNNIFPADTIYYCIIREDQKIEKSMVYHNGHIVESKESLDPISSHVILV